MKIHFSCTFCDKAYSVDAALAGRKGRCKDCGAVMQIPAASAATANVAKPRPRPTPRVADVDDPYGLDDSPSASPMTIRSDMLADDGGAPLPRRGASKWDAGRKKKKRKRTAGDGPWNLPLRTLAVNATGLALIGSFVLTVLNHSPGFQRAALIFSMIQFGVALVAATLTTASVVGAGISLARGNRRAFSGERFVGQLVWCYAVFQAILVAVAVTLVVTPGGRARMAAALGRSLPTVQRAELPVYEDLIDSALGFADELAGMFERFPDVDRARLAEMLRGSSESRARAETTPLPTRDQVRFLKARFDFRARVTMERLAASGRVVLDRIREGALGPEPPQSALESASRDIEKMIAQASGAKATLDRLGPDDDLTWYRTILSPSAGTKAGAAPVAAPAAPVAAPAAPGPTLNPDEIPPDVREQIEESRRRIEEMRRGRPSRGFSGPAPTSPPGQLPPDMQRELERFQRESGTP